MARNLLLLSYYFPPGNIIGAVRPYQMACYFRDRGWSVTVLSCKDAAVPDDFPADMTGLNVRRLEAPPFLAWLNSVPAARNGVFGKAFRLWSRGIRFFLRSVIFPESFIVVRRNFLAEVERLNAVTRFDLVISSALPFTVHEVAREFSVCHAIPWVADNRDLWAASPYRKSLFPRRGIDCRHERTVLADAHLVLGISQAMIDYYRDGYGLDNALLVMNGYSATAAVATAEDKDASPETLDIVYGGGLYGGLRDPSPLLEAIAGDERLAARVRVRFFGSEPDCVAALAAKYSQCTVESHGRVGKREIAEKYRSASVLLVILGGSDFENGVMTGKFFEYLTFGRPVLAIASERAELARVVNHYGVGLASNEPARIRRYLTKLLDGELPLAVSPPEELSIEYQLSRLMNAVEPMLEGVPG